MRRFELGKTVMTRGIYEETKRSEKFSEFVLESFNRYLRNDWGDLCKEDSKMNDLAVERGDDRILAEYRKGDWRIWIITEWDRSATTILFPEEY